MEKPVKDIWREPGTLYFADAPKNGAAQKQVPNDLPAPYNKGWTTLSDLSWPAEAAEAAEHIMNFVWSDTVEGHDFWSDVYHRLLALSQGQIQHTEETEIGF